MQRVPAMTPKSRAAAVWGRGVSGGETGEVRRTTTDETRTGCDGDEAGDGAGAEADGAPLALQTPIQCHPGKAADGRGDIGDDDGLDGAQVGADSRAAVEAIPAKPEQCGAEDDVGDVAWAAVMN